MFEKISIVLLAAGFSERFGSLKQLFVWQGKSFVRLAVEKALTVQKENVFLVLGNQAEKIKKEVCDLKVKYVENKNWQTGQASSIKEGLKTVKTKAVIFMPIDQPYLTVEALKKMQKEYPLMRQKNKTLLVFNAEGTPSNPVLFYLPFWREKLMLLKGEQGGRFLWKEALDEIHWLDIERKIVKDIDCKEDLNKNR